jgi:hypothetical protein
MTITTEYDFGDIVYLKTDKEQLPIMVTEIRFSGDKGATYELTQGIFVSYHYDIEFSSDIDEVMKMTN